MDVGRLIELETRGVWERCVDLEIGYGIEKESFVDSVGVCWREGGVSSTENSFSGAAIVSSITQSSMIEISAGCEFEKVNRLETSEWCIEQSL